LKRDFGVSHFSTGDLLRQAVVEGTSLGKRVGSIIRDGGLVDAPTMREVVKTALSGRAKWIMDGYPRTMEQAVDFDSLLKSIHQSIDLALFIQIEDSVLIERVENRRVHLPSGRIYHLTYSPPKVPGKDDVTGELLIHRDDDKRENLERRLASYHAMTKPLIEYYRQKNVLEIVPSPNSDVGYVKIKAIWEKKFGKGK
jgi:adenylate kinase